ncbi:MAG: IS21 family transposase [Nakamurella sp.]
MLSARERMDIIAAYQDVGSYRAAADICGTTHKTVRRVIERAEAGDTRPARAARPHNYDDMVELVTQRISKSGGRISAKRLLPAARAAGYQGSARNFRRLVADQKALWRRGHHRGRRPAVWSPGEYLVIDWADVGAGLHLFCAVLAWSRWRFVALAADEKATTTLALIAEALAAAGGVPAKVLADRMGCLKGGVVANVVVPTPDYVRFAAHYGFGPDFCNGNDPESKGVVENLVGYAQRDLVVPLLTDAEVTGRPVGVHQANAAAVVWRAEVNAAVHSEICAVPDTRLATEREVLHPLPSLRLEIGPTPVTRKVDRLSCVRFASARYSVPTRLIGSTVRLLQQGGRLLIADSTGEVVADHALAAPGEASVLDAHYYGPRPAPNRGPRPKTATEKQFCALGPDAEAFLVGAAAIGNTRLAAELDVLLALGAAHGTQALVDALARAVAFKRFRAADVRSILAAGASAPSPVPAGGALVLDLPVPPSATLAAYSLPALTGRTDQNLDTATGVTT